MPKGKPKEKSKFDKMHLEEIREKALTFKNLKWDRSRALERILQNLEWEFAHGGTPAFVDEVERVVKEVYREPR